MEDLHAVGCYGLQDRDAAGQRREGGHDEEGKPHELAESRHRSKDLGQGDEHQAGAGLHTFHSFKDEDGRNDHHTGEQCYACVKKLNLVDRRVDIHVFLDIGAISDHNAHGDAQGEEDLAHSIKQNLQESLDGQPFEVGRQIDGQSLESGARHACIVRVGECQREDGDRHDHDQHDGHQYFGALLDTFFNAVKDDPGCQEHENHGI